MANLFLKLEEGMFLAYSVNTTLDQLALYAKDEKTVWTPQKRAHHKAMTAAGEKLRIKLRNLGIDMSELPPLEDVIQEPVKI